MNIGLFSCPYNRYNFYDLILNNISQSSSFVMLSVECVFSHCPSTDINTRKCSNVRSRDCHDDGAVDKSKILESTLHGVILAPSVTFSAALTIPPPSLAPVLDICASNSSEEVSKDYSNSTLELDDSNSCSSITDLYVNGKKVEEHVVKNAHMSPIVNCSDVKTSWT